MALKAAHRLRGGERVEIEVPPAAEETLAPESVPLAVVYEDDHVLVVDKPAGMVVHPGAGRSSGTLAAAILAHAPTTAGVGGRSEEHTSELQSQSNLVCRLLLEKKKQK